MKIINIKKFITSLFLILSIVLLILLIISHVSFSYTKTEYKTMYVNSGDTLWSIATRLQNNSYYKGKDVRFIINDIKAINKLDNSNLSANQELKIPVI